MRTHVPSIRAQAHTQAKELLRSIDSAEAVIVSTIERECEALRAGRMLAANALRMRLREAARLYLNIMRAVRASTWTMEQVVPGTCRALDERRAAFAAVLRVELAVLATERAAAETGLSAWAGGMQQPSTIKEKKTTLCPPVGIASMRNSGSRQIADDDRCISRSVFCAS